MRTAFPAALVLLLAGASAAAASEVVVAFNGMSRACSAAAKAGRGDDAALQACERAVVENVPDLRERASNHVNRGVVRTIRGDHAGAETDFDTAMKIEPDLAEAYLNRGALRVRQSRFQEAMELIDRGLGLGPEEPARGYFNRGVARQSLGDFKGAYQDYTRASELAPTWAWPKQALSDFQVARR